MGRRAEENGLVSASLKMSPVKMYDLVRIVCLRARAENDDGWKMNRRAPRPGDVGTLIDVLTAPGLPNRYVVEHTSDDGMTEWLGDFAEDELEPACS